MRQNTVFPLTVIGLLLLTGLALWGATVAWNRAENAESSLPDPGPTMSREIRVPAADAQRFRRHLSDIAAREGWFPVRRGPGITLTMPESELGLLDEMERDPAQWIRDNLEGDTAANPPGSDRVRVWLYVEAEGVWKNVALALLVSVLVAAALILVTIAIYVIVTWAQALRKGRSPS